MSAHSLQTRHFIAMAITRKQWAAAAPDDWLATAAPASTKAWVANCRRLSVRQLARQLAAQSPGLSA